MVCKHWKHWFVNIGNIGLERRTILRLNNMKAKVVQIPKHQSNLLCWARRRENQCKVFKGETFFVTGPWNASFWILFSRWFCQQLLKIVMFNLFITSLLWWVHKLIYIDRWMMGDVLSVCVFPFLFKLKQVTSEYFRVDQIVYTFAECIWRVTRCLLN